MSKNKDSVYVMRQPKHSIVSIIMVEEENLPFNKVVHENLDKLQSISDLIFIFSDRYGSSRGREDKLTNLYRGCAYIRGSSPVVSKPICDIINYCLNIFQCHSSYLITSISRLSKLESNILTDERLLFIQEISMSGINQPILESIRLTAEELGEIYMREPNEAKENWKKKFFIKDHLNKDRLWSTMKSETPIIYLNSLLIKNILSLIPQDKEFIESFIEEDFSYFLVSLLDLLDIKILEGDILKLDIGKLNQIIKDGETVHTKGV